ncbi:MAG: hypothetical protein ACRD1T_14965, partial [Acidimicrobiia bacterium]
VWGGDDLAAQHGETRHRPLFSLPDGIAYSPTADKWRTIPAGPLGSAGKKGVWTGMEVIFWGNCEFIAGNLAGLHEGAAWNPSTGEWRGLPKSPLTPRDLFAFHWTGTEVLVWGGTGAGDGGECGLGSQLIDGAAFNPVTNRWRKLPGVNTFSESDLHSLSQDIWTGREMLIFGGEERSEQTFGAAYSPVNDSWRKLTVDPIVTRVFFSPVWTGEEVLLWGGHIVAAFGDLTPIVAEQSEGARWRP